MYHELPYSDYDSDEPSEVLVETHTQDTRNQRNCQLDGFARAMKLDSYDGFDVGLPPQME